MNTSSLKNLLNEHGKSASSARQRWRLPALAALALIIAALCFFFFTSSAPKLRYATEKVSEGPLVVSVSASGALQPTRSVHVGSELSGTLESVLVRENDRVVKGQLLAQMDTSKLKDAVARSQAAVTAAEANVAQAEATLAENNASLSRMRKMAELSGGKAPALQELESADAAVKRASANLASARAEVSQARAALMTEQTNVHKATIRSPTDGVVLAREVEPGQTVAAAMTTPVLFVIAEDLTQMELHVNVDEADVSQVREGMSADFTVAAWGNRKFPATVERVDLGATTTDNVVTYTTVLKVANDDLALRPGMTASVEIITTRREKALLIPNAALRFTPPAEGAANTRSFIDRLMPAPPRRSRNNGGANQQRGAAPTAWILHDGLPQPVTLKVGISNGAYTEVLGGELSAGAEVITEYQEVKK
ncbi:MAG: efflux RND transporter periplasmic adaptor subunit [Zoogloeaceae bacterium]|jgi:HlyD family secretion protein|nr:efflux RND transporter periplasmic adaptor subunit [Zoogloeaceae bacterium]